MSCVCVRYIISGLILSLCTANERRRYKVTRSLIAWAQTRFSPAMCCIYVEQQFVFNTAQ